MGSMTYEIEPEDTFNQACLDIIAQWRNGEQDEAQSKKALMRLMYDAQSQNRKANQARAYGALSFLYNNTGHYQRAVSYAKLAQRIYQELGNDKRLCSMYISLGEIYRLMGNFSEASKMYEQALALTKRIGHDVNKMFTMGNYGHVALARQQYSQAKDLLEETLDMLAVYLQPDNPEGKTWMVPPKAVLCEYQSALAETYLHLGEYDKSWDAIHECYEIALELDRKLERAMIYRTIGQLKMTPLHDPQHIFQEDAHQYFEQAITLFTANHADADAAYTQFMYGQELGKIGERDQAKHQLKDASNQFVRLGMMTMAHRAIEISSRL